MHDRENVSGSKISRVEKKKKKKDRSIVVIFDWPEGGGGRRLLWLISNASHCIINTQECCPEEAVTARKLAPNLKPSRVSLTEIKVWHGGPFLNGCAKAGRAIGRRLIPGQDSPPVDVRSILRERPLKRKERRERERARARERERERKIRRAVYACAHAHARAGSDEEGGGCGA